MRPALLMALLLLAAQSEARDRRCRSRGSRTGDCASVPLLEAFTASGAGTSGVCSTTAPTGTKSEALTFSRASLATCQKTATGGLATTGIAVGDYVELAADKARMEYSSSGVLFLRRESAGTNLALLSEKLDDVSSWTATAIVSADTAVPPNNTSQLSDADQLNDNSGVAQQGVCQSITTTSATKHTFFAHAQADTATAFTVTMTGTGSSTGDCSTTVTGLSATTYSIASCTSPAAYEATLTAVTVCILVGSNAAATGRINAWGADHKVNAVHRTSYVPTAGAAATRATEGVPTFPFVAAAADIVALAVTVETNYVPTVGTTLAAPPGSGNPEILGRFSGGNFGVYMRTPGADLAAGTWAAGTNRWAGSSARMAHLRGTTTTGAATTITGTLATVGIGSTGGFGDSVEGLFGLLCGDVGSYTRCVP